MARIRATLVAIAVVAGVASGGLVAGTAFAPVAGGATPHRAMVVVETGAATYHRVVTFTSDSITGIRALELAGAQPVVYSFTGQGGAVCRLFGVGRDAGPNCLGGADGDNRYWAYFRAPTGSSSFTYSRAGAGSTQVHDGDVEGWKFGTGTAPAYAGLPPVATTTTRPASPPPPPVGGSRGSGTATSGAPVAGPSGTGVVPPTNLDPQALAAFLAAATTTTTTLPPRANNATSRRSATQVKGKQSHRSASGPGSEESDGGSGAGSLVLFAVVALALVGGGLLLRRSRRHPVS